ncbi:MAG: recombination mediator RecR [Algisphaera sp.]
MPSAYDHLLDHLQTLPGIGKRSAERIAFHLLKQPEENVTGLAHALRAFRENLKVCSVTGHVSESDPCAIACDPKRDHSTILVVEQPTDVISMEQTGAFHGSYHVLMGRVAPLEAIGPGDLNVQKLLDRIDRNTPPIVEVILGTNPTLEGDGTAMYLAEQLAHRNVKVTRLARGLPTGSNLQTVSKAVLSDAVKGRVRDF